MKPFSVRSFVPCVLIIRLVTTVLVTGNLYSPANDHATRGWFSCWYIVMTTGRDESNRRAKSWNRQRAFRCSYFFLNACILGSPSVSEQQVDYKWKHSCSDLQRNENEFIQTTNGLMIYKYNFDLYTMEYTYMYVIKNTKIMKI